MQNEPVLSAHGISALITAVIALLVAFGLNVSEGQTAAIIAVVAIAGQIVAALVARSKVTPTASN